MRRDGFALVPGFIDTGVLSEVVDKYEREVLPKKHSSDVRRETHGEPGGDGLPRVVHVSNLYELPELAHLAADPRLLELASACLGGGGVRPVINAELFDKPPQGNMSTHTPPHQDNFYFKAPEAGLAVWISLDEIETDSGAVQYVQGSHLRGLRFHEWDWGPAGFAKTILDFTDEDDELVRDVGLLKPGDVVVHHALTIHFAPSNLTSKRRRGLVVNYVSERVAGALNDDLYQPVLTFECCGPGCLRTSIRKHWPERASFAACTIKCALQGWCGVEGGIGSNIRIDNSAGELLVEISDHGALRQAILALVSSGHVIRDAKAVRALPPDCESAQAPPVMKAPQRSSKALVDRYSGVWMLRQSQAPPTLGLDMWLQAPSGAYVAMRIPNSLLKVRARGADECVPPLRLAETCFSGGLLSVHGEGHDILVRDCRTRFQPFDGTADVVRVSLCKESQNTLIEAPMVDLEGDGTRTWARVERTLEPSTIAVLELFGDEQGREGYWIVMGSWFGRVVGWRSEDILSNVVCKSLPYALEMCAEEWGIDPDKAVLEYEASLGRVESAGIFRIVHDIDPAREGKLLLDTRKQQLRRSADDSSLLHETWSDRQWKILDLPHDFAAFGKLKRGFEVPP